MPREGTGPKAGKAFHPPRHGAFAPGLRVVALCTFFLGTFSRHVFAGAMPGSTHLVDNTGKAESVKRTDFPV